MTVHHPAQYSPEVIALLRWLIPTATRVHDPFAGPGTRLGSVASDRAWTFTGTEIEPAFIIDQRVVEGDATDPASYPPKLSASDHPRGYVIVTSPVYPNGMADNFLSRASDTSRRRTYRHALAAITANTTVQLHPRNMGRWGYRGTKLDADARAMYWHLARQAVACWGSAEQLFVNVSDFMDGEHRHPVVAGWSRLLLDAGWVDQERHPVATRRWRDGAGRDARVESEQIIHARR